MIKVAVLLVLVACASAGIARRPQLDGRIVGGSPANIEDYPYQLSLRYYGSHLCGASIVNANWAITAAHCVSGRSASYITLMAGSNLVNNGGTIHQASIITVHSNYLNLDYDYAVVKVSTPFPIGSSTVQPIALQSAEVAVGSDAVITGWGAIREGGPSSNNLLTVTVPIVSDEDCNNYYGGGISPRMICAGLAAGGKDSCQGDSGGPMRVGSALTGIVSWGYGCARPKYPGIYAKILPVRSWIISNTP